MFTLKLITLALLGVAKANWQEVPTITEWIYKTTTVIGPEETQTHVIDEWTTENAVIVSYLFEKLTFTATNTQIVTKMTSDNTIISELITVTNVDPVLSTVVGISINTITCTITSTKFDTTTMVIDVPVTMTHVRTVTKFDDMPVFRTKTQFVIETDVHRNTVTATFTSYTSAVPVIAPATTLHHIRSIRSSMPISSEALKVTQQSPKDVCLTKGCVKAAAKILDTMDDSVEPCDDFFKFACGGFLKKKKMPDEKTSLSQFNEIDDELQEKLRSIVESEISAADPPSTVMVKNLYKSCMNTDYIEERGTEPLKEILKEMGGWPVVDGDSWEESMFEWNTNIYINRLLGYSIDYLFDFSVTTNIKNSTWRIIDIDQPPLGMPSRKYLLKGLNDTDVQAYLHYQVSLAELLGANRTRAEEELKESTEFEIQIANFSLPKEERRNATKLYNLMTIKDLQDMAPGIPWLEFINKVLHPFFTVEIDEPVVVNVPDYVKNIGKLLKKTPKRTIANYLMWRASAASVGYLSEDVRDLQLDYSKKLTGKGTREARWKECMGSVSGSISHAIGSMYASKFFKENAKAAADEMVRYIRAQFDIILSKLDWMDEVTRERAIKKSKAITTHIAYPPELLDQQKLTDLYAGLEVSSGDLLENMRNLTVFGTNYSFKRLRERVNKTDWKNHGDAAVVNAYYSPLENSIEFPAGILQGTFFDAERPKYLNFGGIGFVIGHEITHGFDDTGRQFDAVGDLRDWWEKETKDKFLEKTKCIIYQYGNYTAPEVGLNLNGINTQGENIADNGGIKEAYYAYNQWVLDNKPELGLPALQYSSRQLFWLSAANVWCGKYRPETLKLNILTGAHSPAPFRVNGPFSNLYEFSKDWSCPLNSTMNPIKKCSVW